MFNRVFGDIDIALRNGMAHGKDPGDAGVLVINAKGLAIFEIATGGAETRVLDAAASLPVGQLCAVIAADITTSLQITGANVSPTLSNDGECALFMVTIDDNVKEWRLVGISLDATALGTVSINTGDATTEAAIIALADALQARGLVTHTWTGAT